MKDFVFVGRDRKSDRPGGGRGCAAIDLIRFSMMRVGRGELVDGYDMVESGGWACLSRVGKVR